MDASRFDALAKHLSGTGTRRRLLGALVNVPLAGGILAPLAPDETDAHGRRKRRVRRNRHGGGGRRRRKRNTRRKTCSGLKPTDDLQAAIHAAIDGDTLILCAGVWNLAATLEIDRSLTLVGAGAGQTILDGLDQRRVLQIFFPVSVTLQALTITRGRDSSGGAGIRAAGYLTLIDVAVTGNHVVAPAVLGGGAIINHGNLTLRNSRITGNTSEGPTGGGIFNMAGVVSLESGSRIEENSAAVGGGVANHGGQVTLEDGSQVARNTANVGGGISNGNGGSVTLHAGSRLEANSASPGGAIYNLSSGGPVTVEAGALICNNSAPQCHGNSISGACPSPVGDCPA
ncbi:MAG: hypothetical protein U0075_14395 [Thermomicrobiales bacterium]